MMHTTQLRQQPAEPSVDGDFYHFCVVCPNAQEVYVVGEFNGWSTTATPMRRTEENVWQLSLRLSGAAPRRERRFSYFVIDRHLISGRAPFGSTYLLPGIWAAVVRTAAAPN